MTKNELKEKYTQYMMSTYAPYDIILHKGQNASASDLDGKTYIDFGAGIGVNSLGFCNEEWIGAVTAQLETLQHTSNLYYNIPTIQLAEKLCTLSGMSAAFFANSGTEANECAIKVARKASFDRYGEGRYEIITLIDSFHGRSFGSLAATGQAAMHPTFAPLPPGFRYVPAGDINALKRAIGPQTCAIMLECVQGEGGVNVLEKNYLQAVSKLCKDNDLNLIVDEVQTGIGRTGKLFAFEHAKIKPDILTVAKGLGAGLPIGGCLIAEHLRGVMTPSSHGSTFGGNPVVCAGALEVLEQIAYPSFLQKIAAKGTFMESLLSEIEGIESINRLGLMIGFKLKEKTAKEVLIAALEKGLLILTAKDKVRILPPLTISEQEIEKGVDILKEVIDGPQS